SRAVSAIHCLSFPTRRSSDLILRPAHGIPVLILELVLIAVSLLLMIGGVVLLNWSPVFGVAAIVVGPILLIADCICFAGLKSVRSEEHTSELQSRFALVCRLP